MVCAIQDDLQMDDGTNKADWEKYLEDTIDDTIETTDHVMRKAASPENRPWLPSEATVSINPNSVVVSSVTTTGLSNTSDSQ